MNSRVLKWRAKRLIFVAFMVVFTRNLVAYFGSGTDEVFTPVTEEISQQERNRIKNVVNFENNRVIKLAETIKKQLVLLVQVHNRPKYLAALIESLRKCPGIERTHLIFSHDVYSEPINDLVRGVNFTDFLQIFYPYSMQLYPDEFPGQDSLDCAPKTTFEKAKKYQCQNWESPDFYGHYRDARYVQIKHHWWWKMNFVFEKHLSHNYTGWVLLLEEDNFVLKDAVYMFEQLVEKRQEFCPDCSIINLASHSARYDPQYQSNVFRELISRPWKSKDHNIAMALSSNTWKMIRKCAQYFCHDDDYNWDWSLMRLSMKCTQSRFLVLQPRAPRVFHIGDCGIHSSRCRSGNSLNQVESVLGTINEHLFPSELTLGQRWSPNLRLLPKRNGGWGDPRDIDLCLRNSM